MRRSVEKGQHNCQYANNYILSCTEVIKKVHYISQQKLQMT